MNWSGPNFLPKWITFGPDQFILVVTISFWSWPNHYGQVQINSVRPKPFWTDQNCFGPIEGQGIRKVWMISIQKKTIDKYFDKKIEDSLIDATNKILLTIRRSYNSWNHSSNRYKFRGLYLIYWFFCIFQKWEKQKFCKSTLWQ